MFSLDDSGFKKHMLIITIVLIELLSIDIILAAAKNTRFIKKNKKKEFSKWN